jgi:hypothetical protein
MVSSLSHGLSYVHIVIYMHPTVQGDKGLHDQSPKEKSPYYNGSGGGI